jgi:hypothetical protein
VHHDNRVAKPDIQFPTVPAKRTEDEKMLALQYFGNTKVQVEETDRVAITDPTDAIIKVTASTICGSDLHLYHKEVAVRTQSHPSMQCTREKVVILCDTSAGYGSGLHYGS